MRRRWLSFLDFVQHKRGSVRRCDERHSTGSVVPLGTFPPKHPPNVRVYLVEQSPTVARILTDLIETADAIVVGCADNALQAIADIGKLRPDAVTIDIALREGTGLEVLRSLAGDYDQPPLRIVFSDFIADEYQDAAQQLGAEYFLDKKKHINELLVALSARWHLPRA